MRICEKHLKRATETLTSRKTGEEFDLCPECEVEIREILYAQSKPSDTARGFRDSKSGRNPGRPKKKVA